MLTVVLGAPGSGKSSLALRLRRSLKGYAVIDWDDYMPAVAALVGRDVRRIRELWPPYCELIRALVVSIANVPTVLLGVCTPDELSDWPTARWILLDCGDEERRHRLAGRPTDIPDALTDAAQYRRLGLSVIDTTGKTPDDVVHELGQLVTS